MIIDKAQLKAIADASLTGDWYEAGDLRYEDRKTGDIHGLHHDDDRFIVATSPATVLTLLAEIEKLEAARHTIECRFEVSEDTLSTIRGCLREAESDIDQLKAENEALRKDAQRYRWLRQASATDGEYTHGVCIDLWENGCGFEVTLEEADAAVDTAMAKEANRD